MEFVPYPGRIIILRVDPNEIDNFQVLFLKTYRYKYYINEPRPSRLLLDFETILVALSEQYGGFGMDAFLYRCD
ncbi:MAG: hypothetical protein LBH92_08770 [Bacteroidales bacterium]|nr:hypothetical protein [Bacteroidales bacterium]